MGLGLVPVGVAGAATGVAPPQRHATHASLQVDATAAAGTVVDPEPRMAGAQLVPHRIQPFDVADLRDALAVGRVGLAPEGQRIDVEVVPIHVQAELADLPRQEVGEPAPGDRIAELKQAVLVGTSLKDELAMLAGDLRSAGHALGLKPEDEPKPAAMAGVADRTQPSREVLGIGIPVAHPVGKSQLEPRRIEPMAVATDPPRHLRSGDLAGLGLPIGPPVEVAIEALHGDRQPERPALLLGNVMEKHQAPEPVVGGQPIALPG